MIKLQIGKISLTLDFPRWGIVFVMGAAIGNAFGAGDGSSSFHLPDLRGRFLRGVDGSANVDPDKAPRCLSGWRAAGAPASSREIACLFHGREVS
jgi:microcystin-dependent protein